MRHFLVIVLLPLLLVISCSREKSEKSACIKSEIRSFYKDRPCGDAIVKEYLFQGRNVFVFDPGTCGADMTASVLDNNCTILGYLGGIAGNTTINGEDFSHARFIRSHFI